MRKNPSISISAALNYFSEKEIFEASQGLSFAVGLVDYDGNKEVVFDKTYGEIVFTLASWGINEDESIFSNIPDLETYPCTPEELGLTENDSTRFMPLNEDSRPAVALKQASLVCMKKEDSFIYGDYNSNNARMIRIMVRKCVDKPYCKTEKEMKDFFTDKYMFFINN